MAAGVKIIGSEALQKKLNAIGRDAPKAQRYGLSQAAQFLVKMLKWTAPAPKKNEFATGATRKAIGRVEQRPSANVYQQWVGIKDITVTKKMYVLRVDDGSGKFIELFSPKKKKRQGFIEQRTVEKRPFVYSTIYERRNSWFRPTWSRVRGQAMNIAFRKTDEKIKQILAKRTG